MIKVGDRFKNNEGYECVVVDYKGRSNIYIVFEGFDMKPIKVDSSNLYSGRVHNPFHKSVRGVGYYGQGDYVVGKIKGKTEEDKKCFTHWNNMITRCYYEDYLKYEPSYLDKEVAEEWHNYQNYAKWHFDNYYEIEGEIMGLDKDILFKGNKIYSPDTCIFVPQYINSLFVKAEAVRGNKPIGVTYDKKHDCYCARITKNKEHIYLGCYNSPEQAFKAYKKAKEQHIKEVADEYKGRIPDRLYEAMYIYEVEITD